ncbi:MAG: DUF1189 family protein [Candidatus Pacebacteria bacterium]|nr:DUF1189 family protein [Candidatus Paceibacterota bacterium]
MKKVRTFFYVLKNSIISSKYYNDVISTDVRFSIRYFIALSFLASLFYTTITSAINMPKVASDLKVFSQDLGQIYPSDLVIEFKDGSWSINKEEPYYIKMPKVPSYYQESIPENLITFDKNGTIDKLGEYNTLVLLNGENFVIPEENGTVSSQSISSVPDITIDKNFVDSRLNEFGKILKFLPYILPIFTLFSVFAFNYLIRGFFNILIVGLGLFIVIKVMKKNLGFKSALKIGMHSMTVPLLLEAILASIPNLNFFIPGWILLTSLLIGMFFLSKMKDVVELKKIDK